MRRKKLYTVLGACMAVAVTAIAGYSFGLTRKDEVLEDVPAVSAAEEVEEKKDLPVMESMELYATCSLAKMADKSTDIIIAEVVEIGETTYKYPERVGEVREGLVAVVPLKTAVTLKVTESLKGAEAGEEIIYYQDGGTTEHYRQRSGGYELEEGMEIFLFVGPDGGSYGGQGEFLIFDDCIAIPNQPGVLEYLENDKISTVQLQSLESEYRNRIGGQSVDVISIGDFSAAVRALAE